MKKLFTLFFLFGFFCSSEGQSFVNSFSRNNNTPSHKADVRKVNFNGQWRGSFNETTPNYFGFTSEVRTTYVLELEVKGSYVKGYSYTYFNDPGDKRYYTICRITGSLDARNNKIEITEVERIKYNTPPDMVNCFQIHSLYYVKGDDNTEYLKGTWVSAPNQQCDGKGTTLLSRLRVSRVPLGVTLTPRKKGPVKRAPVIARAESHKKSGPKNRVEKVEPKVVQPKTTIVAGGIPDETNKPVLSNKELSLDKTERMIPHKGYEKRRNEVVKSIRIASPMFQVNLYDNGIIDGDSVSLFYNGRLILAHQRLSDKPITITLSVDKDRADNVLTMYAENLGTIPPNTALMIVRDGDKRYEVRMESDLGKSGTVIFTH